MSYIPTLSAETWTLLALLLGLILLYGCWPFGYFKKLGIPGPRPLPFFGTIFSYRKGFTAFDMECFQKYGKVWGIYDGRQPLTCVMDTDTIKAILVKECYSIFTNRRNFGLNGELYDAISIAEDDQWRRIRGVLSPTFTSGRLKEMFGIILQHSQNLLKSLKKKSENNKPADMKELFGGYSMDVVTSTAFSVDIDSLNNPNDPFVANIKKMLKFDLLNPFLLLTMLFPFVLPVMTWMNFALFPKSVTDFFYGSLRKIKSEREASKLKKTRVDFMQLMVDSQKNGMKADELSKGLSDHEILSQAMMFIFAGYETSSSTLSFMAYNLATHPETMKKLQEEIDTVFPNKARLQYEPLMQMEYLDSLLNETLRLYPIAPRLERFCKKTVEINGVTFNKGTVVVVPTFVLHRDPDLWEEPLEFRPDRFSAENKASVDPYTYMPFGAGPRNCIGMRFAMLMIKLAMVQILQEHSIVTCPETEIPLQLSDQGLLAAKNKILLRLVPRNEE